MAYDDYRNSPHAGGTGVLAGPQPFDALPMSNQSLPLSHAALSGYARAPAGSSAVLAGLSAGGVLLFINSVLVIGSGFTSLRPMVMGLLLHPILVPIGMAFPIVVLSRISDFPPRVLASIGLFTALYTASCYNGSSFAVSEIFKTATAVITIITTALLVRRRGDMVAGALGLSLAVAVVAFNGLKDPTAAGVEAIQGANKNSYSLFALPAILMAGYITLRMPTLKTWVKTLFIVLTLPALLAIFMSGNRSGYLGCLVIAVMLFWDKRAKGLLLVGVLGAIVTGFMIQSGATKIFDEKLKETVNGYEGDEIRKAIIRSCWEIGFDNPVLGVSPQTLPFEIGRRLSLAHGLSVLEAHNIFAHLFAGSGILCLGSLILCGWTMFAWRPRDGGKITKDDPLRDPLRLLRMMVVLWCVRGMFTRDILFNPCFNVGLGLSIGLCMLAEDARNNFLVGKRNSPVTPALPAGPPPAFGSAR